MNLNYDSFKFKVRDTVFAIEKDDEKKCSNCGCVNRNIIKSTITKIRVSIEIDETNDCNDTEIITSKYSCFYAMKDTDKLYFLSELYSTRRKAQERINQLQKID